MCVMSHAESGDMVSGAIPMPAETSDTASARWRSNIPLIAVMTGTKMLPAAPPTRVP